MNGWVEIHMDHSVSKARKWIPGSQEDSWVGIHMDHSVSTNKATAYRRLKDAGNGLQVAREVSWGGLWTV